MPSWFWHNAYLVFKSQGTAGGRKDSAQARILLSLGEHFDEDKYKSAPWNWDKSYISQTGSPATCSVSEWGEEGTRSGDNRQEIRRAAGSQEQRCQSPPLLVSGRSSSLFTSGRSGRARWLPRAGTGIQAILGSPDLTLPAHGPHHHHRHLIIIIIVTTVK